MNIQLHPIAFVSNKRTDVIDDNWSQVVSVIELAEKIPNTALNGIEEFSHLEIIFYMHSVPNEKAIPQYRHPRNNPELPKLGTYAQRNKNRPNKLGLTIVELVERKENKLVVKYLDAINGTPILDIKPVFKQFLPKDKIEQPDWVNEIMKNYW